MKKKTLLFSTSAVCLLTCSFPSLCSTSLGKDVCLWTINRLFSTSLEIQTMSLGWLQPQTLEGLQYVSTQCDISCKKIFVDQGLLPWLFHPRKFSLLEITSPHVTLKVQIPPGKALPIQEASFVPHIEKMYLNSYKELITFQGSLHIQGGILQVQDVTFSPIEVQAFLSQGTSPSTASISIDSRLGTEEGKCAIEATLSAQPTIQIQATHFPLQGVDGMITYLGVSYPQILQTFVGPVLDMQCNISMMQADIQLQSEHIKTYLSLHLQDELLTLTAPATTNITLTPKGASLIEKSWNLQTPMTLSMRIENISIPLKGSVPVFTKAAFAASITIPPYILNDAQLNLQAHIQTDNLSSKVACEGSGEVLYHKLPSSWQFSSQISELFSSKPSLQASLQTQRIPTAWIDVYAKSALSQWIGEWIQAEVEVQGDLAAAKARCTLYTPQITIKEILLSWNAPSLTLQTPTTFVYQLPKKGLFQESPTVTASIDAASWSPQSFSYIGSLHFSSMTFTSYFPKQNYVFPASELRIDIKSLSDMYLHFHNPFLSIESTTALSDTFLEIKKPTKLVCHVSEESLPFTLPPSLSMQKTDVSIECDPIKISLQDSKKTETIHLALHADPVTVTNPKTTLSIALSEILADATLSLAKNTISVSYQMNLDSTQSTGSSMVGSWKANMSLQEYVADVQVTKLPVLLLEGMLQGYLQRNIPLSFLVGTEISANVHMQNSLQSTSLQGSVQSPTLQLQTALLLKDNVLSLSPSSASQLQCTLSPKAYKAIFHTPFSLQKDLQISGSITQLSLPLHFDLDTTTIGVQLSTSPIRFQGIHNSSSLTLSKTAISLQKNKKDSSAFLDISSQSEDGALHITGKLSAISPLEGALQVEAQQFPSSALDFFTLQKTPLYSVILGPSFSAKCDLCLEKGIGPLQVSLQSPKAHLDVEGQLTPTALTLKKDLQADLLLTQQLIERFVKTDAPIAIVSSPRPITLWAKKEGFSLSLHKELSAIEIPHMQIDIGKFYCAREGIVGSALEQLKSTKTRTKEVEIWFAPMDIHVIHGSIQVERTEFLLDRTYDMALWGNIDLPKNFTKLTLGITAQALKAAFGMKQLPKDYVLKIPIEGPLDNIQVKSSSASSKIAALLLWQSDILSKAVGPLGGILKQVIPPPGGEGKTPSPKRPFPWEGEEATKPSKKHR